MNRTSHPAAKICAAVVVLGSLVTANPANAMVPPPNPAYHAKASNVACPMKVGGQVNRMLPRDPASAKAPVRVCN